MDLTGDAVQGSSSAASIAGAIHSAICGMCSSVSPRVVIPGVPSRIPGGLQGLRGSYGTVLK